MGRSHELEFDPSYFPVMVVSGFIAYFLSRIIFPEVSKHYIPVYQTLSESTKISWNNLMISNIHSLLATSVCIMAFLYEENMSSDPIWQDCPIVRTSSAMVAGYLIQDIFVMLLHWNEIGGMLFVFHHLVSVYAYFYVAMFGVVPWFANFRLLAEISTFFVNNRWFFDTLKMKRTEGLPFINGILMTLTFFVARILAMPPYWYKVYTVYGTPEFDAVGHIKYVLFVTCISLDVINSYWFYRMCVGVMKVLTVSSESIPSNEGSRLKAE